MVLQKIKHHKLRIFFFLALAISVSALLWTPKSALATPKCAVVLGGAVTCPINVGQGTNDCYIYDPSNPNPKGSNHGWQKKNCNDAAYKKAATGPAALSTCNDKVKSGCQDPALNCKENCDIVKDYVNPFINVLAALVGVVVTISIVVAGIQYAASADDPQKVSQAKSRIAKSLVALVGFFVVYAFLQWLVPGGFFN